MSAGWIAREVFEKLLAAGTTAFRLWTGAGAWVERFGDSAMVSASSEAGLNELAGETQEFAAGVGWNCRRVYGRLLVRTPGAEDRAALIAGEAGESAREVVLECGLRYEVDFAASYSVGLFCDQRENRNFLKRRGVKKLLNTFSYTCAFSVVAAVGGAKTTSVDVSKSALERGRANFEWNGIAAEGHRFVVEDVGAYLQRLVRRGEMFDAIVLDPPTFGRGGGKRTFQITKDFPELVRTAGVLAAPGAAILLSSNYLAWTDYDLEEAARDELPPRTKFVRAPRPVDFDPGMGAASVWAIVP